MKHLIPMTKFVMERNMMFANKEISFDRCNLQILQYAYFLTSHLKLDMFEGDKAIFKDCKIRKESTYEVVTHKDCTVWISWNKRYTIEELVGKDIELVNNDFLTTI